MLSRKDTQILFHMTPCSISDSKSHTGGSRPKHVPEITVTKDRVLLRSYGDNNRTEMSPPYPRSLLLTRVSPGLSIFRKTEVSGCGKYDGFLKGFLYLY